MGDAAPVERSKGRVRSGLFEIDLSSGEVFKDGRKVALQEQPFRLLSMLLEHPGQVVTREELQTRLWPSDTYVGFEDGLNNAIRKLRLTFGDSADNPRFIQTVPRHGYRFIGPISRETSDERVSAPNPTGAQVLVMEPRSANGWPDESSSLLSNGGKPRVGWRWLAAVAVVAALIAGVVYWRKSRATKLTESDTIVIADFDNRTGDPIFDGTLKEALVLQLQQSPFFNLLPDRKVAQTLKLMHRPVGQSLTENLACEVCLRTGSKAIVTGSIAGSGAEYAIGLKAVNCQAGRVLAHVEAQAAAKGAVLNTLASAAIDLRSKLGEPPNSVQKYAASLGQATMPSLEAMKQYSLAYKAEHQKGFTTALSFYTHAVRLDPGFAYAYLNLAIAYGNLNETGRSQENARKAYELREATTEQQRLLIEANYYSNVTGELEKAAQAYERLQQNYPRNPAAYGNLEVTFDALGNYEMSLEQAQEALRLEPDYGAVYSNVAVEYQNLNRFDEAEAMYKQAEEHHLSGESLLFDRYLLGFSQGDTAKMAQMSAAAIGKPGMEDLLLASQADTEGWYGRFKKARELTQKAMDSAQHNDATETPAIYRAEAALREVEAGNRKQARADANAALKLAHSRDVRTVAALALARAGDTTAGEKLAGELDVEFPVATLVQRYWLPTIRAAVALENNDPNHAVELLQVARPIELSANGLFAVYLCPVYVRGEAYLRLRDGRAAAAEFQKYVDHRGLLANFPWGALARLGLARAYALDVANGPAARDKARKAYEDFFTLWKDADTDIPIYRQAKAEYAKMQ
jgi:DNA-binding winged helix-turn-helix (wHTH) protein/tetratricopeptide (TPR) repeat protein